MKIVKIEASPITLPLVEPFKIAFTVFREVRNVVVKVYTDEGIVGIGESSPTPKITGETQKTVLNVIKNYLSPAILGLSPFNREEIEEKIDNVIRGNSSAKAAIDMAIYDIIGKALKIPVNCLIGGCYRKSIAVDRALSIKKPEEMSKDALKLVEEGYKIIKVKIGVKKHTDIKRVKEVRDAVGDGITIRVDANQAYSPKEAIWIINRIKKYEPEFIEQPTPAGDLAGLARVVAHSEIPIMADESVHSPKDAIEIVRRKAADIINIKLMKSGGILNAIKISSIAEAADIPCCIGCMLETRIATIAGVHLASAIKNIKYAELVGFTWLKGDPATGIEVERGKIQVPETPGLGVIMEKVP